MSRSTHQLQQQQKQQLLAQAQQIADNEAAAAAAELFDLFCSATTMRQVLGLYRNMCDVLGMRPAPLNEFYPKLKTKVRSWKAAALWKKFDARAAHRAYAKGTACNGSRVLVIGAGPCGLRTAIEAQLLGAKVVVVEKRDRISRNNVLHLWPFVITDLRNLGAKKFYGKFCAGSIDHISIRQLQCILLKVALLLGVEVHEGVSFEGIIEPSGDGGGWRAGISPADHAVSHYEFDVLIGADGKRNTLEGFKRKEFRGKLAIAITANFINKKTEAEAAAEEISGVAFIFNQSFFKEFYHTTGIDLENIVYYKDETHYFVMTAKKHSLLDKGVIMQDFADPAELLAPCNVNTEKLLDYAREAAEFSTKYQMPNLEFAVNHYGKPDVAMFDFTSMFAAETSCRVIVRKGFRLLQCLVGDSLLEPFWPTGSGCARGFLSSMDAAYALKLWANPRNSILGVLAQRESIYRLLNQTTPENLQRDIGSYTVDPATRYPNLNRTSVNVWQVKHLIDTDDISILEQTFMDTNALQATQGDVPSRRKRRNGDTMSLGTVLLSWICAQLHAYEFTKDLTEVTDIFTNGKVLCALINRYRPDLIDFNAVKDLTPAECNELAFKILDKEMQIPRIMSGKDSIQMNTVDAKVWLNYLEQICEVFRGEVPHVKHPKMDFSDLREKHRTNSALGQPDFSKLLQISSNNKQAKSKPPQDNVDVPHAHRRSVLTEEQIKRQRGIGVAATAAGLQQQAQNDTPRRAKKRRSAEKAANIEERQQRLKEIEQNRQERMSKRRQQRYLQTQNFYKSLHMLQANTLLRESDDATPFEDYSIFMYRQQAPEFNDRVKDLERKLLHPDRDRSDIPSAMPRGNTDEQFNDRIKSMEQRMVSPRNAQGTDKKPKDLMRAIGKIESSDWNVREIEKKIEQSRKTEVHGPKGREKVPKWSKEQFQARQKKMSKPARQESVEEKFKEIDQTLKNVDKQLKEGRILEVGERGRNKVASIAGQFIKKDESNTNSDDKNPSNTVVPKSSSKVALAFKKQAASEKCHFCKQTVYLMEKINAEGLVLHRSCLKCHHCHTNLRPGGYAFDRDDPQGRFYCTQHFRLPAKAMPKPLMRRSAQRKPTPQQQQQQRENDIGRTVADASTANSTDANAMEPKTPEKLRGHADNIAQLELLDRGQTPERIEFENADAMSDGEPSEEHIIDEHEWSGRNFLPESNNDSESEISSSDESDTESDSDMFVEANGSPIGAQTLQLVTDWIGKQNYSDSEDFYDSSDGAADDGKDDTDGEEFKKARELRREEVRLLPLPPNLPTDTETEAKVSIENKENINEMAEKEKTETDTKANANSNARKFADITSEKSNNSNKSFKSAQSITDEIQNEVANQKTTPPTKADIEKLEQNFDRKLSSDIDAINEKLYRLNSIVKMNKEMEALAKENLVKSDILKKLNMKEKWLADNNVGNVNNMAPKSKFEDKYEKIMRKENSVEEAPKKDDPNPERNGEIKETPTAVKQNLSPNDRNRKPSINGSLIMKKKGSTNTSRSNSFKSNDSASTPRMAAKLKTDKESNKMEIEKVLDNIKKIDISSNGGRKENEEDDDDDDEDEENAVDRGKRMYNAAHRVSSPQVNKRLTDKMKEIQAQSFANKMDSIKLQVPEPAMLAKSSSNVDLSKYFPNQKQDKPCASAANKNQKTLKDVDLAKYFPPSPQPQRRNAVVTVADKLKQNQMDKDKATPQSKPAPGAKTINSPVQQRAPFGRTHTMPSFRDHQLDGAADMTKKATPIKVKTSTGAVTAAKKGGIKIIKKIVPRGTKARKAANLNKNNVDELDEILDAYGNPVRSPSLEYQQLFKEEKSPSDDISDKIERILEETGIDLGIPPKQNNRSKLMKTKSLEEQDLSESRKLSQGSINKKDDGGGGGRRLSGVQNILKRFESLSSIKSDAGSNNAFKLRRMESTTSNLDKSHESLQSRESDTLSDLDRTMEHLKTEWQSEATNFMQKKRENFFAQKRAQESAAPPPPPPAVEEKKTLYEGMPVQYRESKIAKFFGLNGRKSPEKTLKRKSPEKKMAVPRENGKKSKSPVATKANHKPNSSSPSKPYNSMEELAILSAIKKSEQKSVKPNFEINKFQTEKILRDSDKSRMVESSKQNEKQTEKQSENPKNILSKEYENKSFEEKPVATTPTIEADKPIDANDEASKAIQRAEDIRNLPKTGCDKSLSNSRRGSLSSLQSRRLSDAFLTENDELLQNNIDSALEVKKFEEIIKNNTDAVIEPIEEECDSLRTTISKSPSEAVMAVQMRGSSEDESIEKLFSQFSDEMLVDVEFDSNDELVAITPRVDLENSKNNLAKKFDKELNDTEDEEEGKEERMEHTPLKAKNDIDTAAQCFAVINPDVVEENQFPIRPQRRQKSTSSSSEPSAPTAPQRIKNKLNKLCPSNMPPSVQDVLEHLKANGEEKPAVPGKFPQTIEEPEVEKRKDSLSSNSPKPMSPTPPKTDHQKVDVQQEPVEPVKREPKPYLGANKNRKNQSTASTTSYSPIASLRSSLTSLKSFDLLNAIPKALLRKQQSEDSTASQGSDADVKKTVPSPKPQSKEKSLEWDMEKLPNSPMPTKRFVHPDRESFEEPELHEKSPTLSLKFLNNLPRQTMEPDEESLRKALLERDKAYEKLEKPPIDLRDQSRSQSLAKKEPTPMSVIQTPNLSRATTQEKIVPQNRSGTPPMFKKLVIPPSRETTATPQSTSRRSSFAFIELMDNGEPVIAPMPKKLELPKIIPKYVPERIDEEVEEVFKNRPWPKPQLAETIDYESSPEPIVVAPTVPRSDSPVAEVFKNRVWPDGKTIFRRDRNSGNSENSGTKSYSDLRRLSPERNDARKGHNSMQSLNRPAPAKSSRSSADTEHHSHISSLAGSVDSSAPLRAALQPSLRAPPPPPLASSPKTEEYDPSTRMLLDRSKRLHNRNRDFVNERVVERNPYMRSIVDDEREEQAITFAEDELESYRPKHYGGRTNPTTTTTTRFPTSSVLGKSRNGISSSHRDYVSPPRVTPYNGYTEYGGTGRRNFYGTSLPIGSSLIYQNTPSRTYLLNTPTYDRSYLDYTRRSPSETPMDIRTRSALNKDSCIPSESESTSPDEAERNSATEISTDSEFDHDEVIRETPKILIDDTHIRKPTKVQVKSSVVEATSGQRGTTTNAQTKGGSYLKKYQVNPPQPQFKPLVQVDPTLLSSNRAPLQNPRPGDYLLNKTASTEGIASKKSLELKKRYLLGEQSNGNKIQKSGSTSVLDSRIRSFQSNISECQKLLNPSNDISASMRTFLDRTKLGENSNKNNDVMRSATTNVLKDLKVEIKIQKASSTASTDNEKENNVFVNSKNELNKGMEYSDTINVAMQNKKDKINTPTTPTNHQPVVVIETIDLTTPEKCETPEKKPIAIIDLTTPENEKQSLGEKEKADSNKIADAAQCESSALLSANHSMPDVSKDVKQKIPDILQNFVEKETVYEKQLNEGGETTTTNRADENERLLSNSGDEEKMDSPEKRDFNHENDAVQIEVPNIPWKTRDKNNASSATNSSWSSSSSSSTSFEDIQHYILESTTSPDTNNTNGLSVPRVEVHDTTGNLMQIDSLMIVDGKYIGDPEDLKYMEVPEGIILPESAIVKTTEVDVDETEVEIEPITATPEPADLPTIIETKEKHEQPPPPLPLQGPPLPDTGPPKMKPSQLKFDTKNENKIESLKHLPLIVEQSVEQTKAVKPMTLNLSKIAATAQQKPKQQTPTKTPTTPENMQSPTTPLVDNDKTPTADLLSRGSDSETEPTGTGQVLTETELSDWTADDCLSENFIDTEFVLNSNKGTMKRNRIKRKSFSNNTPKYLSSAAAIHKDTKTAPMVDIQSMFNTIDFEDIEFMDTGSEGSCAEAYSATNTALLKNRGYMEFIETNSKQKPTKSLEIGHKVGVKNEEVIKRNEKLGIDYIEQGAYLMQDEPNSEATHDLLKTPVNEETPDLVLERRQSQTQCSSLMTQSLTDSSTLNDLEDDSLGLGLTASSQTMTSVTSKPTTATTTTTEESEALTVVTSPIESSSPKIQALHKEALSQDNETPSSSDKQAKTTTQSTCSPMSGTSSKEVLPETSSTTSNSSSLSGHQRKMNTPTTTTEEQLSYEEYVRALQQKVAQISTAGLRDSLDARKQRRKSSKGDGTVNATNATQTVIEQAPNKSKATETTFNNDMTNEKQEIMTSDDIVAGLSNNSETQHIHKVPEIPTLTSRLEEISKERAKQKDLIHDLVMDKLQSKKQLNAEKRLHRSRQRSLLTSSGGGGGNGGYSSGSSLSPTPKIAATAIVNDANCANKAHYHVSTAVADPPSPPSLPPPKVGSTTRYGLGENSNEKPPTYVAAYGLSSNVLPTYNAAVINRQRPFSAHLDSKSIESNKNYELNKTSSSTHVPLGAEKLGYGSYAFAKPTPLQSNLPERLLTSISTENLRSEARARARLMSNSELGLSPQDKKPLALKCHIRYTSKENKLPGVANPQTPLRELKMSASKSVNDLAYISSLRSDSSSAADENSNAKSIPAIADFTSDPNLLLSSTTSSVQYDENTRPKTKSNRRQKDPDRRKSLIQSISSLFHKDRKPKSPEGNIAASAVHSAHAERTGTSGSNATTTTTTAAGSVDGVLSLFRISPKSKEKSKDKDGNSMSSVSRKSPHERSSSQDCMLDPPSKLNNKNNKKQSPTTTTTTTTTATIVSSRTPAAFSSSSPQLYIHRPSYMNIASDEQTPPPIPPLPINYQRSDDESYATETREQKKQRAISKASRQAELKRLRIAQEIQREQEEIEVQLKELEARGVLIEKALRGEDQNVDCADTTTTHNLGNSDEKLLKELLDIWRNITQLKKRDEELSIRQKELQLEHRHAQLKEELNLRLSSNKLDKSSVDVAAEGAILNEMLEIVAKRAALRPTANVDGGGGAPPSSTDYLPTTSTSNAARRANEGIIVEGINLSPRRAKPQDNNESNI